MQATPAIVRLPVHTLCLLVAKKVHAATVLLTSTLKHLDLTPHPGTLHWHTTNHCCCVVLPSWCWAPDDAARVFCMTPNRLGFEGFDFYMEALTIWATERFVHTSTSRRREISMVFDNTDHCAVSILPSSTPWHGWALLIWYSLWWTLVGLGPYIQLLSWEHLSRRSLNTGGPSKEVLSNNKNAKVFPFNNCDC